MLGYRALAAGVLGGLVLWIGLSGGWSAPSSCWSALAMWAIMGWIVPVFLLKARARRRTERMELELPELLDLLVVTLEAGRRVHRRAPALGGANDRSARR